MDKQKKRDRSINFSQEETDYLVFLIEGKKHIVENKKSDGATWREKEVAWAEIEKEFNSSFGFGEGGVFRSAKHLKCKYEALKRDIRRKAANNYKTGGRRPNSQSLTPAEEKVKNLILLSGDGGDADYSSDPPGFTGECKVEIIDDSVNANFESMDSTWEGHQTNLSEESEDPLNVNNVVPEVVEGLQIALMQRNKRRAPSPASSTVENTPKKWPPLRRKKHMTLHRSQERRQVQRLTKIKIESALLQKKILEDEHKHKCTIWRLEEEKIQLEIALLRKQLENK